MKKFYFFLASLLFCFVLQAQQRSFSIEWIKQKNIASEAGEILMVPGFDDRYFFFDRQNEQVIYTAQWEEAGYVSSARLTNIVYESLPAEDLKNLNLKNIPNTPDFSLESAKSREQSFLLLNLNPIVNNNGNYRKIKSFQIEYSLSNRQTLSTANHVPPISNSVLASGKFYRFYVDKTGVFKLTRNFLNSLGMDVNNIDPAKIKIYGHGGEMLPLVNNQNKYYDPPEIPIEVVGGEDGSFDSQDYILFYGISTKGVWNHENRTNLNIYDDFSYYYITADGADGKRIGNYTNPEGESIISITTFDDRDYYEVDLYSVGNVGRLWFGDRFDVVNSRTYEFNFPNIVPDSDIEIEIHGAATSESVTNFRVDLNGAHIGSLSFNPVINDVFAREDKLIATLPVQGESYSFTLKYNNSGNPASIGYLNYINIDVKKKLTGGNTQFGFTYKDAKNLMGIGTYKMDNASGISEIWDVTDIENIRRIPNTNAESNLEFKAQLGEVRKYVALTPTDYYTPPRSRNTNVDNVNLKGNIFTGNGGELINIDYLIITPEIFLTQANRLADHRRIHDGLSVKVVLDTDIYTEFNSGKQDIGAIRNFVKYVYDNAPDPTKRLKYLLLFGDSSIDYKNRLPGNNNMLPTYHSLFSYSLSFSSTASDDYFGMMDPHEGGMLSSDKLDIAVGRLLADTPQLAKTLIDKILDYDDAQSYGAWRNNFILISDDADNNTQGGFGLQVDLDALGDEILENRPFINVKKIHSDSYEQIFTSGGQRYPDVNKAITDNIEVGAAVVNYYGHGGEDGLASEFIVTRGDINSWRNRYKYNVFVTVTCEFTRFDNPLRVSPGELAVFNDQGGSVALVTTTRTIPVTTGRDFNKQMAPFLFNYEDQGYSVGEAVRRAKNNIASEARRVVFFFGDPAMQLALPKPEIRLIAINDKPLTQPRDTLKALSRVKISGEVVTPDGALINNYNGVLTSTVFDKPLERQTLANDGTKDSQGNLLVMDFQTLGNIIFRGQATVTDGKFDFDFIVPKDITMPVGEGRISFYSKQDEMLHDNRGNNNTILVGDIDKNAPADNKGPEIKLYMNDTNFISGGITDSAPMLLAKLEDENGINTSSGIGHDIIAYIDGEETKPFVLNEYYLADENDYTKGTVAYKLHDLEKGPHTLTFRAWDVYNNSSTAEIQFVVTGNDELEINNVLNYPNPFHDYTEFWFNHNRPFEPLEVLVQVFTVSGKLVWSKNEVINTEGFLSRDITWDGKDDFGSSIGKGVYVYKLSVKSTITNQKTEKFEKLVIL